MTKSSPRMRPFEPSSRTAALPSAWPSAAAAAPRRAAKAAIERPGSPESPESVARLTARLRLLEGFISRTDIADCAQFALDWFAEALGVSQSVCLVRPTSARAAAAVAFHGLARAAAGAFSLSLDDWANPLVNALLNRRHIYYGPTRSGLECPRRPSTPLDGAFHAMPFATSGFSGEAFALLLFSGPARMSAEQHWFTDVFGQKLDQILQQHALREGGQKQGRERSLLYSIINAVSDPILLTDTESRLLIANTRALALFTAAEEESEGRRSAVRMNNMLLSSALSSNAIEETGATRRELLLVNPADGSDLLFELLSAVTENSRKGTGVVSILRNVSDLRRASDEIPDNERKLRLAEVQARAESDRLNLIIDSVADPIVVTDADGATSLMNVRAERLFTLPHGASSNEQRSVQSNDAHFSSFITGMLVSADQRRVGEIALIDPQTGDNMPVEAIVGKIVSEHGELTAVVTILHDRREALEKAQLYEQLKQASNELERKIQAATTDIVQQNELLRRQAMELEQASSAKTQFLANMSHEFRTPLNEMLGYTSMLLQGIAGPMDAPAKRQLGRIDSNGRHLLTIINEILDISRIEAGRMPLQVEAVSIPDLVVEVKAELEPIILRAKLSVTLDVPSSLRALTTDRQKVKQILLNLLSNSLKFTHQGGVTIRARRLPSGRSVELSVADTGIGIDASDQERIFEDFRQLDNSTTRAYGGTGLGLSIC